MIIKSFELNKINLETNKLILLYGENQGSKEEFIFSIQNKKKIIPEKHYENDVLLNQNTFFESITSKSFFDDEKIIIIKKVTNKILKIIEDIIEKNYNGYTLILNADILEKKSKLRNLFEKDKKLICVPFYPDNQKTLNDISNNFLKTKKIKLSQEAINLVIDRANGKREHLYLELEKIYNLSLTKKNIKIEDIFKLTNKDLDYKISELVDFCLAQNKTKVIKSINENSFNNDDAIPILRTFLSKLKRLLKLKKNSKLNSDPEIAITNHKPPIFWKDKEIIKTQMKIWSYEKVLNLIYQINKLEFTLKKRPQLSVTILNNFILQSVSKINN